MHQERQIIPPGPDARFRGDQCVDVQVNRSIRIGETRFERAEQPANEGTDAHKAPAHLAFSRGSTRSASREARQYRQIPTGPKHTTSNAAATKHR